MALHLAKTNIALYLRNKRARKERRRSHRAARAQERATKQRRAFDAAFGRRSRIVDLMADAAVGSSVGHRGGIRFALPAKFTVIGNPGPTLSGLFAFARELHVDRLRSVYVDMSMLAEYDIAANALLDVLVDEVSVQERRSGRAIRWRGTFPASPALARCFLAMGFIKRLRIPNLPKDVGGRLAVFEARCKHYIRVLRPKAADLKSRVTRRFADHINDCLDSIGRELTLEARGRLCQYVGEVLDNAEEHSGRFDWAIQGYLDTSLQMPMCEVAVFNFGRTIAETFEALPSQAYTRKQIQKYIDLHQRKGLFGQSWSREDLFTLISLQGNVSSKNESVADTRGNGTVDLIEFFQRVHEECCGGGEVGAEMTIVSGQTRVLFDGRYRMEPNKDGIRIIAFNNANDLTQRPDPKYVGKLGSVSFPGTLIALKFPLSTTRSTLESTGEQR